MLPLAVERVRYVGEPVVAIAAETRAAAEDAAARVRVEWTPQPAVLSPEARGGRPARRSSTPSWATTSSTTRAWPAATPRGRSAALIACGGAASPPAVTPACRSSRAAWWPTSSRPRAVSPLWMSTQVPHMMQAVLADLFGVAEHRVRVIAPDVGGSFGIKIHVYQDDLAAIAVALTLGRPVKWVATRRESFLSDIHAREQVIEIEVAADTEGVVRGMRAHITAAVGPYSAYPRSSVVEGGQVLRLLPGPYRIRDYEGTLARGRPAQGDHLAVPRGRPSDRRGGDREHAGSDRAGPGARSRRDPPAQPGAARSDAVDVADGQRLRQRVVSRGPRAPAGDGRLRRRSGRSRRGSARAAVTPASAWRASSS